MAEKIKTVVGVQNRVNDIHEFVKALTQETVQAEKDKFKFLQSSLLEVSADLKAVMGTVRKKRTYTSKMTPEEKKEKFTQMWRDYYYPKAEQNGILNDNFKALVESIQKYDPKDQDPAILEIRRLLKEAKSHNGTTRITDEDKINRKIMKLLDKAAKVQLSENFNFQMLLDPDNLQENEALEMIEKSKKVLRELKENEKIEKKIKAAATVKENAEKVKEKKVSKVLLQEVDKNSSLADLISDEELNEALKEEGLLEENNEAEKEELFEVPLAIFG